MSKSSKNRTINLLFLSAIGIIVIVSILFLVMIEHNLVFIAGSAISILFLLLTMWLFNHELSKYHKVQLKDKEARASRDMTTILDLEYRLSLFNLAYQKKLEESYEKLNIGMLELKEHNEKITLLVEMSDILLACGSIKELSNVTAKYCEKILNFSSGLFFIKHPTENLLEISASWGSPTLHKSTLLYAQCWALRLRHLHQVDASSAELICEHIKIGDKKPISYFCVPLMAQNDIYGLLYLEIIQNENQPSLSENEKLVINAFAELAALSLANVRLRENLRSQSIRDPLTSLYNRRYLEDFLFKQLHQAERTKKSLAVLMIDFDYFKNINDVYGHDAGDLVLKELAKILQEDVHESDSASRYGGEEFILVLYDTNAERAKQRAENARKSIKNLQIRYGAQVIKSVSVSIGVAIYPQDGKTGPELIEAADKALYYAKNNGRDQIILFSEIKIT